MKHAILSHMNKIVAVFMLVLGIVTFTTAVRDLDFGTVAKPEGGFAPTIFAAGIIIFSLINLVLEFTLHKNVIPERLVNIDWRKWVLYMIICAVYVFLVKKIGFALDTFICLLAMLKLAGRKGFVKPIVTSLIFSVIVWALFTYAMKVPLPTASWF